MLVKTYGSAVYGIEATTIAVEVNISAGTKYFIVGLPDNSIKESFFRVESAIKTSGFHMPRQRIVVNLSPADIRKALTRENIDLPAGRIEGSNSELSIRTMGRLTSVNDFEEMINNVVSGFNKANMFLRRCGSTSRRMSR